MEQTGTTGLNYAEDKISRLFSKMFFPTLLGLIFNALITIIDGVFVGRGVGPDRGVWAAIPLSEASTLAIICATYLLSARKSAVFRNFAFPKGICSK